MVKTNQPPPCIKEKEKNRQNRAAESQENVLLHHSDPSDSSIHHPPSLFDGIFPVTQLCFRATKIPCSNTHIRASFQIEKPLKEAGSCKVKLSATFHAAVGQAPLVGCTSLSTRLNITSLCAVWRSTSFPS